MDKKIWCGVDFGSSKVGTIIGEIQEGNIRILGFSFEETDGIKEGEIINLGKTVDALQKAVSRAKEQAKVEVKDVIVGITGSHIEGKVSQGFVAVGKGRESGEISEQHVAQAIENSKTIQLAQDQEIIQVIPNAFRVDHREGIKEPVGMLGVRLDANTYIIAANSTSLRNYELALTKAGLRRAAFYFQPIAASYAVLDEEEKESGVVLADIGKDTTDVVVWYQNEVIHTAVIPIGGDFITHDISIVLKIQKKIAEKLKMDHGHAYPDIAPEEEILVELSRGKTKKVNKKELAEIIEARVSQIMNHIKREITSTEYRDRLASGIVLTGGTSLLPGIDTLAEEILDLPVSIGEVNIAHDYSSNPRFASLFGLLYIVRHLTPHKPTKGVKSKEIKNALKKMWEFLKENM